MTSIILFAVIGLIYLPFHLLRYRFINKLTHGRRWLSLVIALILVFVPFWIITVKLSLTNALAVVLTWLFFFAFSTLGFFIASRLKKRSFAPEVTGGVSFLATAIYLIWGYYLCHNVWQTDYRLETAKDVRPLKIAMISDSHIGSVFDGEGFAPHLATIMTQNPDILVIPGDFVDDWSNRDDMVKACNALGDIKVPLGIWYVFGNHDKGLFHERDFSAADLVTELQKNNVHVLEDETATIGEFVLIGRKDNYESKHTPDQQERVSDRCPMAKLLEGIDKSKYLIVLDHEPNAYAEEAEAGVDLVLSGHTHGGQLWPITYLGEWIGMNDRTYGYERRQQTDFIVSSGIADCRLQFKTGTKSEYVIVDIVPQDR